MRKPVLTILLGLSLACGGSVESAEPGPGDGVASDLPGGEPADANQEATQDDADDETGDPSPTDLHPTPDIVGGCDVCAPGSIKGLTCAPNQTTAVPDVTVSVDALGCDGQPVHLETKSNAKGEYQLDGIPCGYQTVNIAKGSFTHQFNVFVDAGLVTDASASERCFKGNAAKIAVLTGKWDAIQYILDNLKLKYDLYDSNDVDEGMSDGGMAMDFLQDQKELLAYDVVFVNCGQVHSYIAGDYTVRKNIEAFVKKGGSFYGSDYADVYINNVWPWAMNEPDPYSIFGQTVHAEVIDPPLFAYLGGTNQQDIQYQLGPISTIQSAGANPTTGEATMVHLRGEFKEYPGEIRPIMLSFRPYAPAGGRVVFANFHHEEQTGKLLAEVAKILNYVVFML
jgi:hypothetical protein